MRQLCPQRRCPGRTRHNLRAAVLGQEQQGQPWLSPVPTELERRGPMPGTAPTEHRRCQLTSRGRAYGFQTGQCEEEAQ